MIQLNAGPFYLSLSRIGEAENPGPAHATAKLFDVQFEAIGQWAANLTSKSEMELTPLLAQLGKCRQMFSQSFEKEPYPYTSSVSQNIQGTHSHMDSFSCLILLSLALALVGNECDESRHVSAQMQFCDRSGKERDNPFLSSREERRTQAHWQETQTRKCSGYGEYPPMQRDLLEWTCQALHSHVRYRRSSHFRNPFGKRETGDCCKRSA